MKFDVKKILFFFIKTVLLISFSQILSASDTEFVSVPGGQIAITNVTLIDGEGTPAKSNQTIIINWDKIQQIGTSGEVNIPKSATIIDGKGKTLIPGLVMMHEHMFYPTGNRHYTEMLYSFPRLYLSGGATTIRTAGTTAPYGDLNLREAINRRKTIGPDMDVTAPYLNGPGLPILKTKALTGKENATRMMNYWASEGVTSYKAYMHIRSDELEEVINQAHKRGHKVTAHLCSITYKEAADLGIDNLEHGFLAASDFVKDKEKDTCPGGKVHQSLVHLDINSKEVDDLIKHLIQRDVVITSTLTVYETFAKGRPKAYEEALEALIPQVRKQYEDQWAKINSSSKATWPIVIKKAMQLEKKFVEAGGKLMVGTDPTGYGGVIAGFANKRMIELLYEAGFSVEEVIKLSSLNGAVYLEREKEIGSVKVGKKADLVLIDGDLTKDISAIRKMEVVFKNGIGYDSQMLINKTKNIVGLH